MNANVKPKERRFKNRRDSASFGLRRSRAGQSVVLLGIRFNDVTPAKPYFLYAGTSGSSGGSTPSSSSSQRQTCGRDDFAARISEGGPPEKNFEDFQKSLDALLRFAAKGVRPMMCAPVHAT